MITDTRPLADDGGPPPCVDQAQGGEIDWPLACYRQANEMFQIGHAQVGRPTPGAEDDF